MNKIKKISMLVIISILLLTSVGCGKTKEQNIEGTLPEIMDKLYEGLDPDKTPLTENIELNDDNIANFVGTSSIDYQEALAREPLIGSIAHSTVLLRAKDDADLEKIKESIKQNINPRKWICVWVEPEDVIIKNKGNLIIAIVIKDQDIRNTISKNFDNL